MQNKCLEKMSFDNKKEAEHTALVAKHQHGSKLKPYKCRNCQLWHLSSDYTSKN